MNSPFAFRHQFQVDPSAPSAPEGWNWTDQQQLPMAVAARAWFHNSQATTGVPQSVSETIDGTRWFFRWQYATVNGTNGRYVMTVLKWGALGRT